MAKAAVGIIGGSGVYEIENVKVIEEFYPETPYGYPSDKITIADLDGVAAAFLPRHGKGHRYLPTEVPVKANIYALKMLGVDCIIAISAVGSLQKEIKPEDFVVPNQIIDRTKQRDLSFFGEGIVGHVSLAEPFSNQLQDYLYNAIKKENKVDVHKDVTYLCMEGPLFSTKAESHLYRSWGCGIIGMTAIPEAKLAREAEIPYGMIAMSTDYDCWNEEEEHVTVEMVMQHMKANVTQVKSMLIDIVKNVPDLSSCYSKTASQFAIITNRDLIPESKKKELELLYGKYL